VVEPDTLGAVDHSGAVRAPTEFAFGLSDRLAPHNAGYRLAERNQVAVTSKRLFGSHDLPRVDFASRLTRRRFDDFVS